MVHPRGEVVLVRIPFHQTGGSKIRPAVVVLDSGDDDLVAAVVTSRARKSDLDLELVDWRMARLNVASTVRLHEIAVLAKTNIAEVLGHLSATDSKRCDEVLCRTFCSETP